MPYATLDQLYEYLPQLEREHDALLSDILARATAIVDEALGFSFAAYGQVTTRDARAVGGEYLTLPAHQLGSVVMVAEVSGKATAYESASAVADYEDFEDGRLWRGQGWTPGAWYRVTAVWGYGPAPASIVQVTLEVAVNIWRGRDASQWSNTLGVEGQGAVSYNRALTWAQRSIIDAVRLEREGIIHA
jgi:hypothetical protein